jgi:hypothetical protein
VDHEGWGAQAQKSTVPGGITSPLLAASRARAQADQAPRIRSPSRERSPMPSDGMYCSGSLPRPWSSCRAYARARDRVFGDPVD